MAIGGDKITTRARVAILAGALCLGLGAILVADAGTGSSRLTKPGVGTLEQVTTRGATSSIGLTTTGTADIVSGDDITATDALNVGGDVTLTAGGTITTTANGDITLSPNGTGQTMVGAGTPDFATAATDIYVQGTAEVDTAVRSPLFAASTGASGYGAMGYRYADDGIKFNSGTSLGNTGNNCFVFTTDTIAAKDHDHDVELTNPTIILNSAVDPDSNNTRFMKMFHNQTDGAITTESGRVQIVGSTGTLIGAASAVAEAAGTSTTWTDANYELCINETVNGGGVKMYNSGGVSNWVTRMTTVDPADGADIGTFSWNADDDLDTDTGTGVEDITYVQMLAEVADNANASGDGRLSLAVLDDDSLTPYLTITGEAGVKAARVDKRLTFAAGAEMIMPNGEYLPSTCSLGAMFYDHNSPDCTDTDTDTDTDTGNGTLCMCRTMNTWAVVQAF